MRYRPLLTIPLLALVVGACTSNPTHENVASDGLVSLESAGGGATVIVSGTLTRESFTRASVRVVGSRSAAKSSDPDQFRATLYDKQGRSLQIIKMWSPLLRLEWDKTLKHESIVTVQQRVVAISLPITIFVEQIEFSWPDGARIATVQVGPAVKRFCQSASQNPSCKR